MIKILGIELPWNLKKIEVIHAADIVRIEIDYLRNTLFPCPCCGKSSKGSRRKLQRMLAFGFYAIQDVFECKNTQN